MHELAVTEDLLRLAVDHGTKAGARRVTALHLSIGQLSSCMGDSVQFYWDIVSRGTICEGARLELRRVPASVFCLDCRERRAPGPVLIVCRRCSSPRVRVTGGTELRLDAIDVDTGDDTEAPR